MNPFSSHTPLRAVMINGMRERLRFSGKATLLGVVVGLAAAAATSERRTSSSKAGGTADQDGPPTGEGGSPAESKGALQHPKPDVPLAPTGVGVAGQVGDGAGASRNSPRKWAPFLFRGFTPTVAWLLGVSALGGAYGWIHLPDSATAQPGASSIEIDFSSDTPGHAPLSVDVYLQRRPENPPARRVVMDIEMKGADLALPGWSVHMVVPRGIHIDDTNQAGIYSEGGYDWLSLTPGARADGEWGVLLAGADNANGPLQVAGANLAASMPSVVAMNHIAAGSNGNTATGDADLTVQEELRPSEDFSFSGGSAPGSISQYNLWTWGPHTDTAQDPASFESFEVEAKSAFREAREGDNQYRSGIAFGLAAGALVGCIQEFLNERREVNRRRSDKGSGPKTTSTASEPG